MHIVRAAALLLGLFSTTLAHATAQRTFVSVAGVDNPTCSLAAPCRAFAAAITAVSPAGEVIVLDSGGYGTVTITKAVSIIAPTGVYAGISVFSGDGIAVNAGASDTVVLRGLTINGQGGDTGIEITSAQTVHVENCVIANVVTYGILASAGVLELKDTIVRNVLGPVGTGVFVQGPAQANLDHVRIEASATGLEAYGGGSVAMQDSLVTGSSSAAVKASYFISTDQTRITISRSLISSSTIGIDVDGTQADGSASINISDSTISDNTTYGAICGGANAQILAIRTTFTHNQFGLHVANNAQAVLDASYSGENALGSFTADSGTTLYTRDNNTLLTFIVSGTTIFHEPGR